MNVVDCDDVLLALARPDHERQPLEGHLASCEACAELVRLRDDEGDDDDTPDPAAPTDEAATSVDVSALLDRMVGPYRITKVLGAGGMGVVYLAIHPEIGSRVAIKVFSRDWSRQPRLVARFFAEARATSLIAHENIVNVLDLGRLDDGRPFLVMEHLPGVPLSALIGTHDLTDDVTKRIMLDVLGALAAAHAHGIVHRDLKPDNIFVSPERRATLLDFGIAKLRPDVSRGATETVAGLMLGTPQYMSPEQARGDPVDARSDLYAIGVILFECFLGRRPFAAASTYRLLEQHVHRAPVRPRAIRPELGTDLEAVILTSLAKRPEERYQNAQELQVALASCAVAADRGAFDIPAEAWTRAPSDDTPTVAGAPPAIRRARHPSPRVMVLGAVALAAVLTIVVWPGGRAAQPVERASIAPVVDAARPTSLDEAGVAVVKDAAAPPLEEAALATPVDAAPAVPTRPQPGVAKPSTRIAPLSLLADADTRARAKQADAVLARVIVRSPTADGRIDRAAGGSVTFDYLSPTLVERVGRRKVGTCVVRVIYGASAPAVERLTTNLCTTLQPLPVPRCSLAAVLDAARTKRRIPPGAATMATLTTSRASERRPLWKIVVANVEYDVAYDAAGC